MELETGDFCMHYDVSGDAAGEPLLWLHGWTGTGADWRHLFNDAPAGFRVIGPDMRGHGSSTGFRGAHSFRQFARDVFALLDRLGIERVKGIGLSGGGITMLHMATQQPERIGAMIAISAPPRFPDQARTIQRQFTMSSLPEAEQAAMRERCKGGQEQIDWLVAQTKVMAEATDDVTFSPELLRTIRARTLIVFGDRDPLFPAGLGVELLESIPGSALWVVPNGGHGPVFGSNAARFAETATEFLKEAQ